MNRAGADTELPFSKGSTINPIEIIKELPTDATKDPSYNNAEIGKIYMFVTECSYYRGCESVGMETLYSGSLYGNNYTASTIHIHIGKAISSTIGIRTTGAAPGNVKVFLVQLT